MNTGINDDEDDSEVERLKMWMFCFGALDYALNSPQSIGVPDEIRTNLEETKRRLEILMDFYEEQTISEVQWRA
jgi:hypothetical protein